MNVNSIPGPVALLAGLLLAASAVFLTACTTPGATSEGPRYQASRQIDNLELPPDLIAPGMERAYRVPDVPGERISARELEREPARARTAVGEPTSILIESPQVQLRRDGQVRWLYVAASPEAIWPRLREFWLSQNLSLTIDEPAIGIMETEWAEDRAGIPLGMTRGLLSRALGTIYDAGTRDQYRLRVERQNGASEIVISHRGAFERGDADGQAARWFIAGPDPELEAAMLNRLLVFLTTGDTETSVASAEETDFERTGQVDLVERDGRLVLEVRGEPDALWRRLGLALDRTGLMVDEQDRREGTYLVTFRPDITDPAGAQPGLIRRVFGGRSADAGRADQRFQVRMIENGRELQIQVLSIDGEPMPTRDERFVLERIQPQLR